MSARDLPGPMTGCPSDFCEEIASGGAACRAGDVELEAMLDEYYEVRGWDKTTGRPTRATLERLGLKAEADALQACGTLG